MPSSDTQFKPAHGMSIRKDGSRDPTYTAWRSMRQRVSNTKREDYADYGGRGIQCCKSWEDFSAFLSDMGHKPNGMTLGRIDNGRGYEPGNCRWETQVEQQNNRRSNRILVAFGVGKTVTQWAREYGLRNDTLTYRLDVRLMKPEVALCTPLRGAKQITRRKA